MNSVHKVMWNEYSRIYFSWSDFSFEEEMMRRDNVSMLSFVIYNSGYIPDTTPYKKIRVAIIVL